MRHSILLTTGLIFSLASITPTVFAKNYIYSLPPPNDTSLYFNNPPPISKPAHPRVHRLTVSRPHRAHQLAAAHLKQRTTLAAHRKHHKNVCRHPSRRHSGIYVYYALPATACCGDDWMLQKANCCAHSGEWQTSYYATFKPAPGDFIYSATNDDEYRSFDPYMNEVANGEIDDPEYY